MKRKIEIWNLQTAVFLTWDQLRRLLSKRLYPIIGRDIHPKLFTDGDFWEVMTDKMTNAEIAKLSSVTNEAEKRKFYAYYSKLDRGISAETVFRLIKDDLPITITNALSVEEEEGIYFFGERVPHIHNYGKECRK